MDPVWGVVMVVLAILLWRIRSPAILLTMAVTMGWAAAQNLLGSFAGAAGVHWLIVGGFQVFWALTLLAQYRTHARLPMRELFSKRDWPKGILPPRESARMADRLAVSGALLSALGLLAIPGVLGGALLAGLSGATEFAWVDRAFSAIPNLSVLAVGVCTAGIVGTKAHRWWAIGGLVVGVATVLIWFAVVMASKVIAPAV